MPRTFGEIPGYGVGATFSDRAALRASRVHTPNQAGIAGGARDGAESIVVSGGYSDDADFGHTLIYTGAGGRDPASGRQVRNQELTKSNAALAVSKLEGIPIRVVRGAGGDPNWSPKVGLRYDGLFTVTDYWHEQGVDGFRVWRFRLDKVEAERTSDPGLRDTGRIAERRQTNVQRIVRSSAVAAEVKALHRHRCQVCGVVIKTAVGPYAEAAHIQPLGKPHDGPDVLSNLLCLCPNDHVRFDMGVIYICAESLEVFDMATRSLIASLTCTTGHVIDRSRLRYHYDHHVP